MLKIGEDKSISVTRGDSVVFSVSQKNKDGTLRVFNVGDVVRFTVVKKKDYSSVVLQKDFAVEESCEVVDVVLTSQETRIGENINKEVEYWYEVEVNPGSADTIIGHDQSGAKLFWLYPEAEAVEQPAPDPEEIPIVDDKLDVTSERPVENRVVAKAILLLEEENENLSQKVNKMDEQLGILASRVKNLSTLKEGSTTGDAELTDIRVGANGTIYANAGESVRSQFVAVNTATEQTARNVAKIEDILGIHPDDEDIIGLEVDFENSTFTRLGAAVGLETGEDFNRFPVYRDRVRCNVADDGTITAICGSGEIVTLCDFQEVEFGEGAPPCPPYDETGETGGSNGIELTTTPHPTDAGSNIKIYVDNVATGESYVFNGTLTDPYLQDLDNQVFGTFKLSNGSDCTLTGFATTDGAGSYVPIFQLFTYPLATDVLKIKVQLERSVYVDNGTNGQTMVYQPKFYYRVVPTKLEKIENGFGYHIRKANYYISSKPKPFFKLHPAFYDENRNPVEYILYSAYEGNVDGGKLCSVAGAKPTVNKDRIEFENLAKARGTGWHIETMQAVSVNQLLFIIEYATFNSRDTIGMGVSLLTDKSPNNCASLTGSTALLGNVTGMAEDTVSEVGGVETIYTENGKVAVSYRGVENLWGNVYTHVSNANVWGDGTMQSGQLYVTEDFDLNNTKHDGNYIPTGFIMENGSYRWASAFGYGNELFDWMFAPSACKGTSMLPVSSYKIALDNVNQYVGITYGGRWDTGYGAGLFTIRTYDVGYGMRDLAARLIFIPTAK